MRRARRVGSQVAMAATTTMMTTGSTKAVHGGSM